MEIFGLIYAKIVRTGEKRAPPVLVAQLTRTDYSELLAPPDLRPRSGLRNQKQRSTLKINNTTES